MGRKKTGDKVIRRLLILEKDLHSDLLYISDKEGWNVSALCRYVIKRFTKDYKKGNLKEIVNRLEQQGYKIE